MSTLVLYLPARPRMRARDSGAPPDTDVGGAGEYDWVMSPDDLEIADQGRAPAVLLPKAATVVAVLGDCDVSWHRVNLPKAPAARMRAALVGLLEEALLDDAEAVHLALAPEAVAGQPTWVAAIDRSWLRSELAALQRARVFVDRVVPMVWPDEPPVGHFDVTPAGAPGAPAGVTLTWAHTEGVATMRVAGGLARALLPNPVPTTTRWSAAPAAAATAEQWLGAPVNVMPLEQRLLQAARSLWNLRQFDLTPRTRGARALGDSLRRFMSPAWRPVRIGAVALIVVMLLGLNLWAFSQRRAIDDRRVALQTTVRSTFPRVSDLDVQRDAAAVMQRETQALRTLAGKPADADFEPMLQAAAVAWPPDRPVENLRYEPGKLSLAANGWNDAQIERFRNQLAPAGWRVDASEGRVVLTRARTGAAS